MAERTDASRADNGEGRGGATGADRGTGQRLRIMEAAEEVILERGLAGARLRDVAKRAGVSVGLVQHYFDTKAALVSETFHHRNHRRARAWGNVAASRSDAWGKVEALIENGVDPARIADSAPIYLEFCAESSRDAELRESMAASYEEWRAPTRAAIEQGVKDGSFHPVLPAEDIVNVLAMTLDGAEIAVTIGATNDPARIQEALRRAAAALLGYQDGGAAASSG